MNCPSCKKEFPDSDLCPRCGCDTSVLVRIVKAAESLRLAAQSRLKQAEFVEAAGLAEVAYSLVHSRESARMAMLAWAGAGDKERTQQWLAKL